MYFELVGKLDVSLMLDNQLGGINSQKFCNQISENNIKIGKFYTKAEVEKWRTYYLDMHPKQVLNEDVLPQSISENDIKSTFNRFFKPLSVDVCNLTIIDPYEYMKRMVII